MVNFGLTIFLGIQVAHVLSDVPLKPEYKTINTDLGKIRGVVKTARNGDKFEAFLGVPYAKPPLDELRWEPPVPADHWDDGVLDATKNADLCFQDVINDPSQIVGSEDCLYVNVFTKMNAKEKKQTLVFFHGGGFIFGGVDMYNANYVMEEDDVILVTVQYRLNAFGFMSTEDSSLPGNYGSLDQVEALRWVQKHIKSFGGDPEEVTIFGMSAGGASISYLTLSPLTKNLYKNSISMSGSPLCWWANVPNPAKQARMMGEHFKCPSDNSKEMVKCLKKVHGDKLMKIQKDLYFEWRHNLTEREPVTMFSPRSDPEREHPFLPQEPYIMLKNGDMNPNPYMIGYTGQEGIWRANQLLPDKANGPVWADFLENYNKVAPLTYGFIDGAAKDPKELTKRVTKYYNLDQNMKEAHLTDEKVQNFINVLSDTMFNYCIDAEVKLRAAHKNMDTYFYFLTYPVYNTIANMANDGSFRRPAFEPLKGASHCTDILLIYDMFPHFPPMPEKDISVSKKFIRLLIDFGKQDKSPIDEWKPLDLAKQSYLLIDEKFEVKSGLPMQDRMKFWDSLPSVYWRHNAINKRDEL